MSRFTAIDLSQLPPPQLIEPLDYERVLREAKLWVTQNWEDVRALRPDLPALDTLDLESEPIAIVLQVLAYRETLLRALVNDKARAVLLAYARGTDLHHIGALYGVVPMPVVATPRPYLEAPGDWETDDRLRRRIQLAPEAFSVAGPAGAYEFHAMTQSIDIDDAHAFSPNPDGPTEGRVTVVLAGRNGAAVSDQVLAAVVARLERDDVVPLTDVWSVQRAQIVNYDVTGQLVIPRGPDPVLIIAAAESAVRAYAAQRYRIGAEAYRVGLFAAAKTAGVDNVILTSPPQDIVCNDTQIPLLGAVALSPLII